MASKKQLKRTHKAERRANSTPRDRFADLEDPFVPANRPVCEHADDAFIPTDPVSYGSRAGFGGVDPYCSSECPKHGHHFHA